LWRALLARLGLLDAGERIDRDDLRRLGVLLLVCTLCAFLVVDYGHTPQDALQTGDVAPRTVKAPFTFTYADHAAHERARDAARDAALPVYVHSRGLLDERLTRISEAFDAGREALRETAPVPVVPGSGPPTLTKEQELAVVRAFAAPLRVQLPEDDVEALLASSFSSEAEDLARQLLEHAMGGTLIVTSRDQLPQDRRAIHLIRLTGGERSAETFTDLESILVPEEARQQVSLGFLETKSTLRGVPGVAGPEADATSVVARALVTANLSFDPLQTEERRDGAASAVPLELETVKRGQILFRAGEVVTDADLDVYRALQEHQGDHDLAMEVLAVSLFLLLLLVSLYHFASSWLPGFTTRVRDVAAVGTLLVLVTFLARLVVASSEGVAALVGFEAEARSVWFFVPVAGAVMIVRLLLGVAWTVPFAVAASVVCGLVMDLQALPVMFFLISGVAAASAVEHSRERIAVVRAGAVVGVVNAVAVLLIHLVQLFVVEGEISLATTMRPFWSMSFAFFGGVLSAFLVLGLVPLFESVGFVTDYRMMELANLNHPLLRQLMLRAPGSYHHSVIVGTLAEAGAEAIGANSLLAKVASYFHDIGKTVKPQYFVENQQAGRNLHAALDPTTSARIIVSHVTDGGRMAKEHGLPQPIVDNIYMHHGTGILQYFYAEALALEDDPDSVDPQVFRYPGPKPNTREAGVIMLADKVEAATRTLRVPDEEHLRAMIARIVNSVVADGQFSDCPLTFQEIHTIADTFIQVLVGIYHQRIEYPHTADLSRAASPSPAAAAATPRPGTITLELLPSTAPGPSGSRPQPGQRPPATVPPPVAADADDLPGRAVAAATDEEMLASDYEAVDYLPRGE
jgi:putative nucleotidyltransferase with HDIG domain